MRGRKPKPTKQKQRAGNPGKRKVNAHEARIPRAIPDCPKHLVGDARKHWKEKSEQLYAVGLLTALDSGMFAALCQAYGRWMKSERDLAKHGPVTLTVHGTLKQSPYVVVCRDALEQYKKLAIEFGMSPSSRSRVSAAETEQMSLAELLFTKTKAEG